MQGCAFASYITFDLSPELSATPPLETREDVARAFAALDAAGLFERVLARVAPFGLSLDEAAARRLFAWLLYTSPSPRDRTRTPMPASA